MKNKKNKQSRIKQFQKLLASKGLDGYVSNDTLDQGFLTGFFRSYADEGILLVTSKTATMFIKQMLVTQFKQIAPHIKVVGCQNHEIIPFLKEEIKRQKFKNIAFDPTKEIYEIGKIWRKNKLKEVGGLIKSLRETKNEEEIKLIKKSCNIAVKAFEIIKKKIKPGRTEKSIALELEYIMKELGASGLSFPSIVAGGPNSALPHHNTSNRKFKNNEVVLLDFGCVYENYCSDMTRTFWLGKKPTTLFKKIYAGVVKSHDLAIKKIKPGIKMSDIDGICRKVIANAKLPDFPHGTGHGVGLEVHEPPSVNRITNEPAKPGMVFSIEPGVYLKGKFGVRHENLVTVTKTGCKILSK